MSPVSRVRLYTIHQDAESEYLIRKCILDWDVAFLTLEGSTLQQRCSFFFSYTSREKCWRVYIYIIRQCVADFCVLLCNPQGIHRLLWESCMRWRKFKITLRVIVSAVANWYCMYVQLSGWTFDWSKFYVSFSGWN